MFISVRLPLSRVVFVCLFTKRGITRECVSEMFVLFLRRRGLRSVFPCSLKPALPIEARGRFGFSEHVKQLKQNCNCESVSSLCRPVRELTRHTSPQRWRLCVVLRVFSSCDLITLLSHYIMSVYYLFYFSI